MSELEAKYLVAAGRKPRKVFRRVMQELSWAGFMARPRSPLLLNDSYFDSADWALQRVGWTYRLREDQNGRRLALKQIGRGRGPIFKREEIEQPVDGEIECLESPPPGPVADVLVHLLPDEPVHLERLFELHNHRTRYHLTHPEYPNTLVELSVDRVEVDARDLLGYTEMEFELRQGTEEVLNDMLVVLEHQPGLIRARVGKYQRGLLASGCEAACVPGIREPINSKKAPWLDLGLQHLYKQLQNLTLYEPLAWESVHPEGVHQLRVTTRRVRTGLWVFGNVLPAEPAQQLLADIRWLTRSLGPVRDLDVHLEHLHAYRQRLSVDERPALERYRRHLEKRRRTAHRALVTALASRDYARLVEDFGALLTAAETPDHPDPYITIRQAAEDMVPPMLDRVLRKGRAIKGSSPARKLHRLRIDVKRLRYRLEYLRGPYGKVVQRAAKSLAKLQDTLGNHQDAYVAMAQLQGFCDHTHLNRVERRTFRHLLATEKDNAARHRKRFAKRWARFEAAAANLEDVF